MNLKPIFQKSLKFCFSNLTKTRDISKSNSRIFAQFSSEINQTSKFFSFQKKCNSESIHIKEIYDQNMSTQNDFEVEINPVTNFLYYEINKFENKTFNLDEFIIGLKSLENITITFQELQQYIQKISQLMETLTNQINSSKLLNKNNIDSFLSQTIKMYTIYGISSPHNWNQIQEIIKEFINDLSKKLNKIKVLNQLYISSS